MNGVDAIAFTAGVGENDKATRRAICEYLGFLGVKIDDQAKRCKRKERSNFCSRFQGKSYADPNQRRVSNRKRYSGSGEIIDSENKTFRKIWLTKCTHLCIIS